MQNDATTLEESLTVSYKTKHTLTIGPSNRVPWYLPKRVENFVYTKTYIRMFIAALYLIAETCKQPSYSSVDEWINKPC